MKVTIIGCGNIGKIYARSFLKHQLVKQDDLILVEKDHDKLLGLHTAGLGKAVLLNDPQIKNSDVILLSVKPQDFNSIKQELKTILQPEQVLVSIMAGITLEKLSHELEHQSVIRAMPNAPIELGMGMTGFCALPTVSVNELRKVEQLLASTGRTVFFENEKLMNAVTALSGSGPAYFYYIIKAMSDAGRKMGFDESTSMMLVKQTMLGAFHQMNASGLSLDELITTVASKGGTTEAALSVFEQGKLKQTLEEGILAAEKRGLQLSSGKID